MLNYEMYRQYCASPGLTLKIYCVLCRHIHSYINTHIVANKLRTIKILGLCMYYLGKDISAKNHILSCCNYKDLCIL